MLALLLVDFYHITGGCFVGLITLTFKGEIRFETMRPIYLIQIARFHSEPGKAKHLTWWWSGGLGWDESLIYDEADAYAPTLGEKIVLVGAGQCPDQVRPMGGHFYLYRIGCIDPRSQRRSIEAGTALGRQLDQQKRR